MRGLAGDPPSRHSNRAGATHVVRTPNFQKVYRLARNLDVGFAERRESAVSKRLELVKKMQERLSSPESEAKSSEHRALVEARNKRVAIKEEARRQEEARLHAIRMEEEARLAAERHAREEEERRVREAEEAEKQRKIEAEKARLAASSAARGARALADIMTKRGGARRGSASVADDDQPERRQA